jgi:inosine/xanthosine triphosphatase
VNIRVGTSNRVKLAAVRKAAAAFHPKAVVKAQPVESGVAPQPISIGEIVKGARNRAERCRGASGFGVGIESGLFRLGGAMFNVTIAAVTDGTRTAIGGSPFLEMPREAVEMVLKSDEELGEALSQLYGIPNPAKDAGAVGVLTGGRVTRTKATELAVLMAFASFNGRREGGRGARRRRGAAR